MLDSKSKYRLIGAGLLIVSCAVLLPLVLDGERPEELNVEISVPEQPAFAEVEIASVESMEELESSTSPERSANDIELTPEAEPTSAVSANTQPKAPSKTEPL